MLLGSFRGVNFCEFPALERQEEAKGAGELEVEGDFVAEKCVVVGGFQALGGSHGSGRIRLSVGYGSIDESGLRLDYLELPPVGDGHGMDKASFDCVARVEVGYETGAEIEERSRGILVQGAVGRGEAMAGAVAGGIALALNGNGSSGTGAVSAGGLDLF